VGMALSSLIQKEKKLEASQELKCLKCGASEEALYAIRMDDPLGPMIFVHGYACRMCACIMETGIIRNRTKSINGNGSLSPQRKKKGKYE